MVAENIEGRSESVGKQHQQSEQLLDSFLNLADFQNTFKQNKADNLPGFPSADQMFIGENGDTSHAAKPTRVADRGDDAKPDKNGNQQAQKKPIVEKNRQGDVSKVTYPNGDTKEFEYDGKHHLTKIKYKNGDYYEKDKNDNWNLHSKHATDSLGQAHIRVENDGTMVFHSQDGSKVMITRADGKIGSMDVDPKTDQVQKVDYPGGDSRKFDYDQNGLSKVTEKNGNTWQKEADGSWSQYDPKGTATGSKMGSIDVDETGDMTTKSVDGKKETIYLPNGTVYKKSDGRVQSIERK